jgi:hypothetical protein
MNEKPRPKWPHKQAERAPGKSDLAKEREVLEANEKR